MSKFLLVALCLLLLNPVLEARGKKKPYVQVIDIDLSVQDQITEGTLPDGHAFGSPVLATNLPVESSCISEIEPPTIYQGIFLTGSTSLENVNGTSQNYVYRRPVRSYYNPDLPDQYADSMTCTVKYLKTYKSGKNYYAYRDTSVEIHKHIVGIGRGRTSIQFPDVGLGQFGMLLSMASGGLSDLLVDSANNIKHSLENAVRLSRRTQEIPTTDSDLAFQLTTLICEIQAAMLSRKACKDSSVIDYSDYVRRVRTTYEQFVEEHRGSDKKRK